MIRDTLIKMLNTYGPSGRETPMYALIEGMLRGKVDEMHTDALGNLICVKKGRDTGKRLLFSAHMDQIGFIVIEAEDEGYLRVAAVGGINVGISSSQAVVFGDGTQGILYVDQDVKGAPQMANLYIDIGAESREEALKRAPIGTVAVYAPAVQALGEHRLASPAMDNRAGCALLAQLMLEAGPCDNTLIAVFSTQEEVGLRGAKVAAYAHTPDLAVAFDVTPSGDMPKAVYKLPVSLNKGAAIKVMDSSLIASPIVRDALVESAKAGGIPYQMEVLPYGGTDAGAIQVTRGGVPSGTLSIPCRYVHSAVESVDIRDMEACLNLMKAFIARGF